MTQEVECGELIAIQTVVHAGGILVMHAAEAPAEWAALFELQIPPLPHTKVLRDAVSVIASDLE
ncbi:hypothetical protein D3C76_1359290 [compost metagenome]